MASGCIRELPPKGDLHKDVVELPSEHVATKHRRFLVE